LNQGTIDLFTAASTLAQWTLSDSRPECVIQSFLLYEDPFTPLSNADLSTLLNTGTYSDDGSIELETDLESGSPTLEFIFYVAALGPTPNEDIVISGSIRVIIGCYDIT